MANRPIDTETQRSASWKRWAAPGLVAVAAISAGTVILLLAMQNVELKATLASVQSRHAVSIWEPGGFVPAVTVLGLQGETRELPDLVDKGALVGFFTTTCPYCIQTLPIWIELQREAERQGVPFLAVSLHDQARTRIFMRSHATPYDLWTLVTSEDSEQLGVTGVPLTVLLQPGGRIVGVWRSALTGEDVRTIEEEIARLRPTSS